MIPTVFRAMSRHVAFTLRKGADRFPKFQKFVSKTARETEFDEKAVIKELSDMFVISEDASEQCELFGKSCEAASKELNEVINERRKVMDELTIISEQLIKALDD